MTKKPNRKILINGDFFCRRLTGIERYAYEITRRLNKLISYHEAAIVIPAMAEKVKILFLTVLKLDKL